jgi:hypothetical protein
LVFLFIMLLIVKSIDLYADGSAMSFSNIKSA